MAEKGSRYIGRKYSDEEGAELCEVAEQWAEESKLPIEGELEKTAEQLKMISLANEWIREELESLGITGYVPLNPHSTHFLSEEVFEREHPDSGTSGLYRSTSRFVHVTIEDSKPLLFRKLLHEMVHGASLQRFHVDEEGNYSDARLGYRVRSSWKGPIERQAFEGFNEIMVEQTTVKILRKHERELERELGIKRQELGGPIYSYMEYEDLLGKIALEISAHKQISTVEVFTNLERGQFAPTMLALKDIEAAFGKGSLQVLACLGVLRESPAQEEVDTMVCSYFASEDPDERASIREETLEMFDTYREAEIAAEISEGGEGEAG